MKCHACAFDHQCRTELELCPSSRMSQDELVAFYRQPDHQRMVQAAAQLVAEGVDLVVAMGLCVGHDLLLQKALPMPLTTLVVKDRTNGHHPLKAIRELHARLLSVAR